MRIITSILLIAVVSLVTFRDAAICLVFKLNQDYFAKNLCVEREVKQSKCKGHCQLAKMVEQSQERPAPDMPFPGFEPAKMELFLHANEFKITHDKSSRQSCFQPVSLLEIDFADPVFHPPSA